MKKLILIVLVTLLCYAETVQESRLNAITALIQKQDMIAAACDTYISLYGTAPASIATLKSATLLGANVTYTGTINVSGTNKTIVLSDTITPVQEYQKDYYLNTTNKTKESTHSVTGNAFVATYSFTSRAIFSYLSSASMTVSPVAPTSPASGAMWLNSLTNQIYYYSSGWISVNPRKLWVVRNISELPTTASVNDGAIVLTTSSLTKYLYNGTAWLVIPQTVPYTYNGAF
ncbi:hypothetical protein [Sulfurospirillum cavolei]|uniref:hypothetical protein n=1 Tax=Sulfurospirillum cavolei TaxID=366522 RepID=UPI003FA33DE6